MAVSVVLPDIDELGDQSLTCAIGGESIARYNHCHDALYEAAVHVGLAPILEPYSLFTGSDDGAADV